MPSMTPLLELHRLSRWRRHKEGACICPRVVVTSLLGQRDHVCFGSSTDLTYLQGISVRMFGPARGFTSAGESLNTMTLYHPSRHDTDRGFGTYQEVVR